MHTTMIEKIERLNLVFLGTSTLVIAGTGWLHLPSFLLAAGVMHLNFWLLKRIVRALLVPLSSPQPSKGKTGTMVLFLGKGLLFLLLLSGLFFRYPIQPLSFLCGVSLLLLTCMIVTLSGLLTGAQAQDENP
ncbi:MAG: hypothetical protein HYZ50_15790 [Deltaproteobacteria bacterium]|nr:hypothetical protein [Deltaproteobacteria bacterium]